MSCRCRCHLGGAYPSCDTGTEQPGGALSCSPCDGGRAEPSNLCERCGAFGDMPHGWIEGDCILPHRGHSPAMIGHVCAGCVERHRLWLAEITELYASLRYVVEQGSVPDDTAEHKRPKKQPASPALLRLEAWAMLYDRDRLHAHGPRRDDGSLELDYLHGTLPDVPAVLQGWASYAIESGAAPTASAVTTVSGAVIQLDSAAEHVARQPWIDEYDAELRWVRQSLRRAHGITDPQSLGACITVTDGRECSGHVWPSRDSDNRPKCDRCSRRYGTLDLVRLKRTNRESA